jgi:histidyl-tRNA synthetase
MALQRARGVRDQDPEQQIFRNKLVSTMKNRFEASGFVPLETPIFERYDVLASKYAGGAEILKETFKFIDQGKRELALRYDLTVPLCRYVGMNPTIKMPFKRYQIGRVFRDGPIKLGRYREFYQCDIDVVGAKGMLAETQLIETAADVFKDLEILVDIKINNRKLMNGIIRECGVPDSERDSVILTIDKLAKIGEAKVWDELEKKGIKEEAITKIFDFLKIKDLDKIKMKDEEGQEGLSELKELFSNLEAIGVEAVFDISLARGLSYYTGTVFEAFLKKGEIKSAIAGGGRYDNMIGNFLGSKQKIPAIGISFGLEVISDALGTKDQKKTVTDVFIIPINTKDESLIIARSLRSKGLNVDLDIVGRGISKNLQYADALSIPYVLIVGEDELKAEKLKLKDMVSGEEKMISLSQVEEIVKKN